MVLKRQIWKSWRRIMLSFATHCTAARLKRKQKMCILSKLVWQRPKGTVGVLEKELWICFSTNNIRSQESSSVFYNPPPKKTLLWSTK